LGGVGEALTSPMTLPKRTRLFIPLESLQPSQLYICKEKLEAVQNEFNHDPLAIFWDYPVLKLDRRLVLTDRHTHALVAFKNGVKFAIAHYDNDELDVSAYRICVSWCLEEGIKMIGDLKDRVLPLVEYQVMSLYNC